MLYPASSSRWAHGFAEQGYGGVRYRLRHDPSGTLLGIALFGEAGEAALAAKSAPIPEQLLEQAWQRFGIQVVPDLR